MLEEVNKMEKSYVDTILESEEMKTFTENHEELINEAVVATQDYGKSLKAFVLENITEFIGQTLEETYKNIRLFSEVATMTFINEATHSQARFIEEQQIQIQEAEKKAGNGIDDYL